MNEDGDGFFFENHGTNWRHPLCEWWKKLPKAWQGRKRKCPCCGRMIYARMEFTKHQDLRKGNP